MSVRMCVYTIPPLQDAAWSDQCFHVDIVPSFSRQHVIVTHESILSKMTEQYATSILRRMRNLEQLPPLWTYGQNAKSYRPQPLKSTNAADRRLATFGNTINVTFWHTPHIDELNGVHSTVPHASLFYALAPHTLKAARLGVQSRRNNALPPLIALKCRKRRKPQQRPLKLRRCSWVISSWRARFHAQTPLRVGP